MRALEQTKPAEQSPPPSSQSGSYAELGSIWGLPPISKQIQDFASGVGEGLAGACKEGVQAVTHPGETINNAVTETGKALKTSCEATVSAAHYIGDKVSHGDINGVAHDAQKSGQVIGHMVAEGANHVAHMNAHDLGKFVGHDVLPGVVASVVAPELAGEGLALAASAASKLGTLAKEEAALSRVVSVYENAKSKIDAISEKMAGLNKKMETLQQEIKESSTVGTRLRDGKLVRHERMSEDFLQQVHKSELELPPLEKHAVAKATLTPVHNMGEALLPKLIEKEGFSGLKEAVVAARGKAFAEGSWIRGERTIRIAEYTGLKGDLVPNQSVREALLHEAAHMIDDMMGGHTPLALRDEFRALVEADRNARQTKAAADQAWSLLGNKLNKDQKIQELWAYQSSNVAMDEMGFLPSTRPLSQAIREGFPSIYDNLRNFRGKYKQ
jgi:hypothetical protein